MEELKTLDMPPITPHLLEMGVRDKREVNGSRD